MERLVSYCPECALRWPHMLANIRANGDTPIRLLCEEHLRTMRDTAALRVKVVAQ